MFGYSAVDLDLINAPMATPSKKVNNSASIHSLVVTPTALIAELPIIQLLDRISTTLSFVEEVYEYLPVLESLQVYRELLIVEDTEIISLVEPLER